MRRNYAEVRRNKEIARRRDDDDVMTDERFFFSIYRGNTTGRQLVPRTVQQPQRCEFSPPFDTQLCSLRGYTILAFPTNSSSFFPRD